MTISTGQVTTGALNLELGRSVSSPLVWSDAGLIPLRGYGGVPYLWSHFHGKTRFVLGAATSGLFPSVVGYDNGAFLSVHGSMSPQSDTRYAISALTMEFTGSSYITQIVMPGAVGPSQFSTLVVNGITLLSSSASFSNPGAQGRWQWNANVGILNGGIYSVYIN